eukprot:CAMPEP_0178591670 /NCGR_PEP_ID=MMETSP0697-20121206/28920_1 /TAXON_ID=265572 /ORGANISM="Extubocellulus spinifer, Strain CCMP396" /LENGTH=43 /DNA_ID= /DNA_START= /DNA_END= /DNA_ORIENTATION=
MVDHVTVTSSERTPLSNLAFGTALPNDDNLSLVSDESSAASST